MLLSRLSSVTISALLITISETDLFDLRSGSTDEPKFYITLKGDSISGLAKRLTKIGEGNVEIVKQKTKVKKRRNETNPS